MRSSQSSGSRPLVDIDRASTTSLSTVDAMCLCLKRLTSDFDPSLQITRIAVSLMDEEGAVYAVDIDSKSAVSMLLALASISDTSAETVAPGPKARNPWSLPRLPVSQREGEGL